MLSSCGRTVTRARPRSPVEPDHVGLEGLAALVTEGKLHVHVGHTLPLEEAARAHVLHARGGVTGKIVLTV